MTTESNTTVLSGPLEQARGVIGREPNMGERFIFEFDEVDDRLVHMVGVTKPLLVKFMLDGAVTFETRLQPWIGHARAQCDTIVETGVR
jgi:hypothetical protein